MAPVAMIAHQIMSVAFDFERRLLVLMVRVTKSLEGCPVR